MRKGNGTKNKLTASSDPVLLSYREQPTKKKGTSRVDFNIMYLVVYSKPLFILKMRPIPSPITLSSRIQSCATFSARSCMCDKYSSAQKCLLVFIWLAYVHFFLTLFLNSESLLKTNPLGYGPDLSEYRNKYADLPISPPPPHFQWKRFFPFDFLTSLFLRHANDSTFRIC